MSWFDLEPINPIKRKGSPINQCIKCLGKWERDSYLTKRGEERTSCPHCGAYQVILGTRANPTDIIMRKDLAMLTSDRYPDMFCPSTTLEGVWIKNGKVNAVKLGVTRVVEIYEEYSVPVDLPLFDEIELDCPNCGGILEVLEEMEAKRFPIATYGKAMMFVSRGFHPVTDGHYVYLFEGKSLWMTTYKGERLAMLLAVMYECPGGRVFVAGLGLGLVLLYLAASRKTSEVVVTEISKDVIGLIEPIIRPWLAREYPNFKWSVIQGDAYEEVKRHGKFDWIYFDVWKNSSPIRAKEDTRVDEAYEASENNLTERGIFSDWITAVKRYEIARHA